jgi:predicted Zn finger-like uncharacterized protein
MILTCPQCATRYQTDAALFGAEGRKVRCAKCANVWHQFPDAPPEPEPEAVPFEDVEPATAPSPPQRMAYAPSAYAPEASAFSVADTAVTAAPERTPGRIDWVRAAVAAAGWAVLAVLVLAIGWSGMHYRQQIATLWPQSASFYAALGKPVNTTGLTIANVRYRNETEDGQPVLAISGRLKNVTSHELLVPPIRVTLTDDDKRVLYNWSFSTSVATLRAGQAVNFVTRLSSPPSGARHLQVQIAEIGK